jgi:hypothetical protein
VSCTFIAGSSSGFAPACNDEFEIVQSLVIRQVARVEPGEHTIQSFLTGSRDGILKGCEVDYSIYNRGEYL